MNSLHRLLVASLFGGLFATATAAAAESSTSYLFEVSYDERPIGTHLFEVERDGPIKRVRSVADFHVRMLFVSLYRYRHEAQEEWREGCLQRLQSRTDDNGRRFEVSAATDATALRISRTEPDAGVDVIPADCAGSFAYWDLEQLQRTALLNSQTGVLTPVALAFEGEERFAGEPALRYSLQPAGLPPIVLWYRADTRTWLGLETRRGDGVLRYRPEGRVAVQPATS